MSQSEFPSASKIESLREQGVVAYSSFSTQCMALIAVGLSIFFIFECFNRLGLILKPLWTTATSEIAIRSAVQPFAQEVCKLFLVPCLAVLAFSTLCGLLQTRFLFRLNAFAPEMKRIWNPERLRVSSFIMRFLQALFGGTLLLGLAICLPYFLLFNVLSLLNRDRQYLLEWPMAFTRSIAPLFFGVLAVVAMLSWLCARYLFLWTHRMSSEELRKEARRD